MRILTWLLITLGLASIAYMLLYRSSSPHHEEAMDRPQNQYLESAIGDYKSDSLKSVEAPIPDLSNLAEKTLGLWESMPWISKPMRDIGIKGGEGAQVPQALAIDNDKGAFLLMTTDVGGVYRSLDGGETWEPSNVGLHARGASDAAIDPHNPQRAIIVACNSLETKDHGLYLTQDSGRTWEWVLPAKYEGRHAFRKQIAYDASSESKGLTQTIYWSSSNSEKERGALFISQDGGHTWVRIPGTDQYGESDVLVAGNSGWLYVGNEKGLYRSMDGGLTFEKLHTGPIRSLAMSKNPDPRLYILTPEGVEVSRDGKLFTLISSQGFPLPHNGVGATTLSISPVNDQYMVINNHEGDWKNHTYYSLDGGETWQRSNLDKRNSFIPVNNRIADFAWHPRDSKKLWSFGGDMVMRSDDAGATFAWANAGYSGLCSGAGLFINMHQPNLIFSDSQDYNGAISTDAGETWKYLNFSQKEWGGFTYGGYALSSEHILGGVAESWGAPRKLMYTTDGGATIIDSGHTFREGVREVFLQDIQSPSVIFAANLKSVDRGVSWSSMEECDTVFTANYPEGTILYGSFDNKLLISRNQGASWETLTELPYNPRDIAANTDGKRLYIAMGYALLAFDSSNGKIEDLTSRLPDNQHGHSISSVAVDPYDNRIVYVAGPGNTYMNSTAVCRSLDGGETWHSLTLDKETAHADPDALDGGREALWVRVHPENRYAYIATGCFGLWKYPPPSPENVREIEKPSGGGIHAINTNNTF